MPAITQAELDALLAETDRILAESKATSNSVAERLVTSTRELHWPNRAADRIIDRAAHRREYHTPCTTNSREPNSS
jgi:hypothetical protein